MNSFVTVAAWPARIFSQNAGTLFELQNAALVGMWHAEQRVLLHTGLVFEDLRVAARVAVVDQRLRRAVGPPKVTACSAARSSRRVISRSLVVTVSMSGLPLEFASRSQHST